MNQRIIEIIARTLRVDTEKVKSECSLKGDLNADSLDMVEIVMDIEREFNIEIPDEDAEKMITVQDVLDYIEGAVK